MGFDPKVWKRVMPSLVVYARLLNDPQMKHPVPRGVWGSSPRNFLASGVANSAFQCHFGPVYHNNPTPSPSKISFLQIYTDLKNGPGSWKKVWNQTKVWKFWSLYIANLCKLLPLKFLMKSLSFIFLSGLMDPLWRSVLSMMIAKARRNTVSGLWNFFTNSRLLTQYLCANASIKRSIFWASP